MVADRALDQPRRLGRGQAVLGLAHELGFRDEARDQRAAAGQQVVAGDVLGLAVLGQLAIGADAFQDRGPEARLMRAALGRRHGVAVGLDEAVARGRPVDRPFDLAGNAETLAELDQPGKGPVGIGRGGAQLFAQIVRQPAGEVEGGLARGLAVVDLGLPADFHAGMQVGLGLDHPHHARGLQPVVAEDLLVGMEGDGGAAAVRGGADLLDRPLRDAAAEALPPQLAVAGDLDDHAVRQCVHDRGADPVQPARGLVGAFAELAARVQGAEDHLQRRLAGELGMRIDGDAAAVVAHHDRLVGAQLDLDAAGMARHRLVHGVVEDLGHEVMQRAFVGAADIHAGALADGFKPFQHLDRGGGIAVGGRLRARKKVVGHGYSCSC